MKVTKTEDCFIKKNKNRGLKWKKQCMQHPPWTHQFEGFVFLIKLQGAWTWITHGRILQQRPTKTFEVPSGWWNREWLSCGSCFNLEDDSQMGLNPKITQTNETDVSILEKSNETQRIRTKRRNPIRKILCENQTGIVLSSCSLINFLWLNVVIYSIDN